MKVNDYLFSENICRDEKERFSYSGYGFAEMNMHNLVAWQFDQEKKKTF
jgi:hypothetical protein